MPFRNYFIIGFEFTLKNTEICYLVGSVKMLAIVLLSGLLSILAESVGYTTCHLHTSQDTSLIILNMDHWESLVNR